MLNVSHRWQFLFSILNVPCCLEVSFHFKAYKGYNKGEKDLPCPHHRHANGEKTALLCPGESGRCG